MNKRKFCCVYFFISFSQVIVLVFKSISWIKFLTKKLKLREKKMKYFGIIIQQTIIICVIKIGYENIKADILTSKNIRIVNDLK